MKTLIIARRHPVRRNRNGRSRCPFLPDLLVLEGRALLASLTTIDFDSLADSAVVTDQYKSIGAKFNGTATILNQATTLNPPFPPRSGAQVIYDSTATIRVDAVGGVWSEVGGYVTGNRDIVMTAYSSNGTSLGSDSLGGANYTGVGTPNKKLDVTASGIAYVQFVGGGNTFTIDDFFFALNKINLQSVTYAGAGYNTITSDPTPSGATKDYSADHWLDNNLNGSTADAGDHRYPVLYASAGTMSVAGKWKLGSADSVGTKVKVRGDGPGNLDLPATAATQAGDVLTLAATALSNKFDASAKYFDHFTIKWEISYDDGKTWSDAGSSDNTVYVSAGTPIPDKDSGDFFETVVHLAITKTDSKSAEADLIAGAWSAFTGRSVSRVDGKALHYYQSYNIRNTTVETLLRDLDGQCSTFTLLFIDLLKVNGISKTDNYVFVRSTTDDGFIVKDWTFTGAGKSGDATYPYLNLGFQKKDTSYKWDYADVNDDPGIAGQNNVNPASLFNNHQIALINGTYYDASYGVTYTDLKDMEKKSIAGYFKVQAGYRAKEADLGVDLDGNGSKTDVIRYPQAYLFRKVDLTKPSLKEDKITI
ncbi:hypothetical protein [Aquisphaera insulae]|uniref:hypothetical protein n=1 Tax=Aquisphaera insulae TaxID=2712864 RepID=UPI0013ED041D|nr:hypothetical protein [Aquisphaera insulae]